MKRFILIIIGIGIALPLSQANGAYLGEPQADSMPVMAEVVPDYTDGPVNIPDYKLFRKIIWELGLQRKNAIWKSDMKKLKTLDLTDSDVTDLTGLEYAVNLTKLDLTGSNQITDLSPLANLKKLTELNLYGTKITDLSPLAGLTNLTKLRLLSNQITDLSPLANLKKLTFLYLDNNQITDLSPLAGLTNLTELSLENNQIKDIQPLVDNPGLRGKNWLARKNWWAKGIFELYSYFFEHEDYIFLIGNPLSPGCDEDIATLEERGARVIK